MNNHATTHRFLASALGLETTVDKILFGIAVLLTVILIVVLSLLWTRRNQVAPHISDVGPIDKILNEKKKAKSSTKYPTITITQKERSNSQGSIESEVSSMWDTQSQKYDQKHFKDTQLRIEIDKCLTAGSRDIESGRDEDESALDEISSCTSDFGSTMERGDEAMVPRTNITMEDETTPAIYMQKSQTKRVSKSQDFEYIDSRDDYYDSGRRGSI